MSTPKHNEWGIAYWEIPHAFRSDVGRVELEEDGTFHLIGIPNPIRDINTARLVGEALVAAAEYHEVMTRRADKEKNMIEPSEVRGLLEELDSARENYDEGGDGLFRQEQAEEALRDRAEELARRLVLTFERDEEKS